jgi:transcription-repair coupling factor (superfamily II helicase)
MHLLGLFPAVERLPEYRELDRRLSEGGTTRAALPEAVKPLALASLWSKSRKPFLVLTSRLEAARRLYDQVRTYAGDDPAIQLLLEPDALPYEKIAADPNTVQQRLAVLSSMLAGNAPLVIAPAYAAAARTIAPDRLRRTTMTITRGDEYDLMDLLRVWELMGYQAEPTVEVPGTMSRRGGILDIYPLASDYPVRVEMWGRTVESLRLFDPATQRSLDVVPSVTIGPAVEMLTRGRRDLLERLDLRGMSTEAKERLSEHLRMLAEGERFEEMGFYGPLVNTATALDYAAGGVLVLDEPSMVGQALDDVAQQGKDLRQALMERKELPRNFPDFALNRAELEKFAKAHPRALRLDNLALEAGENEASFGSPPIYGGRTRVLLDDLGAMLREDRRVVIVSQQAPRLAELLREATTPHEQADTLDSPPIPRSITLLHGTLAEGWTVPGDGVIVLTDAEIFGLSKQRRYLRRRVARRSSSFVSELAPGDFVVHIDHGVGRFAGTEVRRVENREREYLVLEYADNDRLMVPMEQIDRVGPYVGASDHPPALTRLGGQEWQRTKARVKASTAAVARELLVIYAAREVVPGHAFGPDTPWQQEMEAAFPYVETPDQMRTIIEVKDDMEKPKPMDRIVAGDVGYGKTEVAIRAAFKAVMEGHQVAILVPTTVLAQQHFNTFSERLGPFPVRVDMLSRFRSPKEQERVVEALAAGEVDICIGTHRLIQKDIAFKNLGLVIVDEEQRFGVAHKERLKEMRREVDVLSMSATPIPRTLYMALAGVRDMSVMETPPEERLPVKTYVSQWDDPLVREAILRELERGGQVFFVHNRVYNIGVMAERLKRLVPEAEFLIGHGQMPEEQLERVMLDFAQGKADVLLCTTIIESGLDIPNANTLIINDADHMGLAQLYQLRGRVGRSANRAYAYLLYNPERALTEVAEKRLKTILSATELGAGFKIAMKDLEIRGAGNLLGTEQSGNIGAVGLELYVRMLGEAVEELKAGLDRSYVKAPAKPPAPTIELPLPAHLPESYITDLPTRLQLYQRMAKAAEPSIVDDIAEEMKDRFGPWPEPVENLLFMLKVKLLATKAGVLSIQSQTGEVVLAGDETTWRGLLGVRGPHGEGIRIGNTRVRLDIKKLGNRWRSVLQSTLTKAGERSDLLAAARR